jgi:hypothetical protein
MQLSKLTSRQVNELTSDNSSVCYKIVNIANSDSSTCSTRQLVNLNLT